MMKFVSENISLQAKKLTKGSNAVSYQLLLKEAVAKM